tara:strand:+ start:7093 stop:7635 length:543 start_codon:yes stop_codon:yes gene_type:complete
MGKTAKVKTTGRFGSRYGVGIRKRVVKVEKVQKQKHRCPKCGFIRVKRLAAGIYTCTKCNIKIAGGAYIPETMSGSIVRKMVAQKQFLPYMKDLIASKEPGAKEEVLEAVGEKAESVEEKPKAEKKVKKKAKAKSAEKAEKKEKKAKTEKKPVKKKAAAKKDAKPKKGKKEKKEKKEKKK